MNFDKFMETMLLAIVVVAMYLGAESIQKLSQIDMVKVVGVIK